MLADCGMPVGTRRERDKVKYRGGNRVGESSEHRRSLTHVVIEDS